MADSRPRITLEDIDEAKPNLVQPHHPASEADRRKYIDAFNLVSEENFQLKLEVDRLRRSNKTSDILDDLIKPYADRAFFFMCGYCVFAGATIFLNAWNVKGFKLGDDVLQILVGSTAVTVIGLVGMVLTGIFVGARKL